jgi:hypothetical protein
VVGRHAAVEATTVLQAARSAFSSNPLEGRRRRPQFVTLAFVDIDQSSTSNRPYLRPPATSRQVDSDDNSTARGSHRRKSDLPSGEFFCHNFRLSCSSRRQCLPFQVQGPPHRVGLALLPSERSIRRPPRSFLSVDRTVRCSQRPQHPQAQRALHTVILRIPFSLSRTTFPDGTELFATGTVERINTRARHTPT